MSDQRQETHRKVEFKARSRQENRENVGIRNTRPQSTKNERDLSKKSQNLFSNSKRQETHKLFTMGKTLGSIKILEKKDVIEQVLWSESISEEEVVQIIISFYQDIVIVSHSVKSLFKLLILHEKIVLFDKIVDYCSEILESGDYGFKDFTKEDEQQENSYYDNITYLSMGKSKKKEIYDYDQIVSDAFAYSISINKLHVTFYLFKVYKRSVYGNRHLCIESIIDSLRLESVISKKINFIDERLFILTKMMKSIDHKLAFELFDTLEEVISDPAENNFLVYMINPIKTIVKIIYIIRYLITKHPILEYKGKKIREALCSIGNHIIYLNTDLKSVENTLVDKIYSGATTIDLIANIELIELLTNSLLDSVVSNLHIGSYQRNYFMDKSLCFQIVQSEINYDPDNEVNTSKPLVPIFKPRSPSIKGREVRIPIWKKIYTRIFYDQDYSLDLKNFKYTVGHQFKFEIWRKSPDAQHLIDSIIMFLIGLLMVFYANQVVNATKEARDLRETVTAIEEGTFTGDVQEELDELSVLSAAFVSDILAILILNTISIGYFLKDIQELIFCNVRNIVVKQFTLRFNLNIISTLMVLYWHQRHWSDFTDDVGELKEELRNYEIIQRIENDPYFNIYYFTSILTSIQFFRLIIAFRLNRTFGPMAKTLGSMAMDIFKFLAIFFSIFICFLSAGTLLFSDLQEYKDFIDAFNTLFAASFANYDPTIYASVTNVDPYVGYIFITFYLLASSILLLNFLIAILSTTYSLILEKKDGLYIQEVIFHMQRYSYDSRYSSLVSAVVPFNIFFIPVTPLILSFQSARFNKWMHHVQYTPIAL